MYVIFAAIVIAGIISVVLTWYGGYGFELRHSFAEVTGIFCSILTGISALVYSYVVWEWIAAEHKAKIINREYGTHYTQEEVFYAHDVIEVVRQIARNRYEINGDIIRGKDAKP